MSPDQLREHIQIAQSRLEFMTQRVDKFLLQPELLSTVMEELSITLEELHTQHEELLASRRAVEVEKQRYQELFEFAPDGYVLTNSQGTILQANYRAATLLNVRQDFLVGKPLSLFVAMSDRSEYYSHLTNIDRLIEPDHWQLTIHPRDQESFPASISVSRMLDPNFAVGLCWLLRDITKLQQAEDLRHQLSEEQELHSLKSRLIQTISHELRNPLTSIQVCNDILKNHPDQVTGAKRAAYFSRIDSSVIRITDLLEEVVTLNQLQSSEAEQTQQTLDLVPFCQQLVQDYQMLATEGLEIEFMANCQDCVIRLNRRSLHRILDNLLSNALKYSPETGLVTIELNCLDQQVIIKVIDRGIGIPAADLPRVFHAFHRGSNIGIIGGSGLGLSIAQRSADLLQGTITIESKVGIGSTFTLTLPRHLNLPGD